MGMLHSGAAKEFTRSQCLDCDFEHYLRGRDGSPAGPEAEKSLSISVSHGAPRRLSLIVKAQCEMARGRP